MKLELSPTEIQTLEYAMHLANQYYIKTGLTLEKDALNLVRDQIASQRARGGTQ